LPRVPFPSPAPEIDHVLDAPRSLERGEGLAASAEALHEITLSLFAAGDTSEIAGEVVSSAGRLVHATTSSIWVPSGDEFACRGAIGEVAGALNGRRVHTGAIGKPIDGEEGLAVLATGIAAKGNLTALLRVSRAITADGGFTDAEHDLLRHLAAAAGAAIENVNRTAESKRAAADAARDLATITEMSREITATLDLDRVLRSVVNLATRMFTFDRGAIALYERGACDIRAVAGAETVDAKDAVVQDLAVRAAWAAGRGEHFYLSDRTDPGSDAERLFIQIFGEDLERDGALSGLYLPLKDEEGIIGILLFEAERADFATPRQRELAETLANQATVAVRNAQLYRHVPMAETFSALAAKKEALLAIPRRRRVATVLAVLAVAASLTLIRWPLRVDGVEPTFRPLQRADVRPTIAGVIDRVFVREGTVVERGAPIVHLRDDELRAELAAAVAAQSAADRAAAMAAARGDAAEERLQRLRSGVLRRDSDLLDEQIRSAVVRAPVSGVVLTPRPEERVGTRADAGDLIATVGRTDSLELELGVDQRDITRVDVGNEVRVRVDALPQRTFSGRVVSIGALALADTQSVRFPVRAVVANDGGLLRPGMVAYARVLTAPASVVGRFVRSPARGLRLLWWRMWS
jgi:multidrug efflux pump subunit AcrA (membrane-fusion protein)